MKFSILNLFQKNQGFTLIEIVIAISVMSIGILGIYALLPTVIFQKAINFNKIIAIQLAREALEIVRNIRDTNWLKGLPFDEGLVDGEWRVQYDKNFLLSFNDEVLKINGAGFYNYDSGESTKFKRKIIISHINSDTLNIKAEVSWLGRGSPFLLEENLSNWR